MAGKKSLTELPRIDRGREKIPASFVKRTNECLVKGLISCTTIKKHSHSFLTQFASCPHTQPPEPALPLTLNLPTAAVVGNIDLRPASEHQRSPTKPRQTFLCPLSALSVIGSSNDAFQPHCPSIVSTIRCLPCLL